MRAGMMVVVAMLLAGCGTHRLPADAEGRVAAFAVSEQSPQPAPVVASWYAGGDPGFLACAEIEAPAALKSSRATLRLVYDLQRGSGQIEYHELWRGDALGEATIANNRLVFDALWKDHCSPYAPATIRFAHLIGR